MRPAFLLGPPTIAQERRSHEATPVHVSTCPNGCDLMNADETTDSIFGQTNPDDGEFAAAYPKMVEIGEHYRRGLEAIGLSFHHQIDRDHPKYTAVAVLRALRDEAVCSAFALDF